MSTSFGILSQLRTVLRDSHVRLAISCSDTFMREDIWCMYGVKIQRVLRIDRLTS